MKVNPCVAVCIGCFNRHYLEGAIRSVSAQTYPNLEIWAECSTDRTAQIMDQLCGKYPDVEFFGQAGISAYRAAAILRDNCFKLEIREL
jgi:glycosyltransferase involved in cell wall biosynthesis